jgi:hypothetical protein
VDGVFAGRAPVETNVPFGVYEVRVEHPSSCGTNQQKVKVDAPWMGVSLSPGDKVSLRVTGQPGARLKVDGREQGVLPAVLQLSCGSHSFEVEESGGTRFVTEWQVKPRESGMETLVLGDAG